MFEPVGREWEYTYQRALELDELRFNVNSIREITGYKVPWILVPSMRCLLGNMRGPFSSMTCEAPDSMTCEVPSCEIPGSMTCEVPLCEVPGNIKV